MNELNFYVIFGILSRLTSITLLSVWVLPAQWAELKRQHRLWGTKGGYWKLALELLLIVLITIACAIVPITYQGTRIYASNDLSLQNMSSFFTNFAILAQSIGWVRIYKSKYDDRL